MRAGFEIEDLQLIIFNLLDAKTSSPWDRWDVILGYPEEEVFKHFNKAFIYVLSPIEVGRVYEQGGLSLKKYKLDIGAWNDANTGGIGEINIMVSQLSNLFSNPKEINFNSTFDVTLGNTDYSSVNLTDLGCAVIELLTISEKATINKLKENRYELSILIEI